MELTVEKRDLKNKPKSLRNKGILPAVIYGRSEAATPISVDRKTFEKVFRSGGESTVITIKGLGEERDVLIHEVVTDAVHGEVLHADFYAIEKGQTVTVSVPLEFDGISPAVQNLGGILVKVMHELEIEVQPKELPHAIHVDISKLEALDSKITIADLKLPPSAILSDDKEEVVAMIAQAEEEPAEETPVDLTAIGVSVEKGKKEEEGGEAPAAAETK